MSYVLGIDIGGSTTTAAVCRRVGDAWGAVQPVALDAGSPALESTLELIDGVFVAGARTDGGATDPTRVARDLTRRVGDDVPLIVGGEPYLPQNLVAALTRWAIEVVWQREGAPAEQVVLSHPSGWGPFRVDLLGQALAEAGVPGIALLPAAVAAAESHEARGWLPESGIIAVYRLGGRGVDATVLDHPYPGVFRPLGGADLDGAGGAELDDVVLARVRSAGRHGTTGTGGDPDLPRRCTTARERLSTATEVKIGASGAWAGLGDEVRLTRAEFDQLARPVLRAGLDLLPQAARSCGITTAELAAVLLAGGAARTPLVTSLLSGMLHCPVLCDTEPALTVATGAALAARRLACGGQLMPVPAYRERPPLPRPPDRLAVAEDPLARGERAPLSPGEHDLFPVAYPDEGGSDPRGPARRDIDRRAPGRSGPDGYGASRPDPSGDNPAGRPARPPLRVTSLGVAGKDLVTAPCADDADLAAAGRRGRSRR